MVSFAGAQQPAATVDLRNAPLDLVIPVDPLITVGTLPNGPVGEAAWLTLVTPDDADGVELLLEPTGHPAAVALQQALYTDGIPLAQLYAEDVTAEFERLRVKGVAFRDEIKTMGPTKFADFDDTCGNLIRLAEG